MIPKKTVMIPIKVMLSFLDDFPEVIKLYNAVTKMVIGIINSTIFTFRIRILKTESSKAIECPSVKRETKIKILFQSLKS